MRARFPNAFDSDSFDCVDRERAVPLSPPYPRLGPLGLERLVGRAGAFTHPDLWPSGPTCGTWIAGYGWRGPAGPDGARGDGASRLQRRLRPGPESRQLWERAREDGPRCGALDFWRAGDGVLGCGVATSVSQRYVSLSSALMFSA